MMELTKEEQIQAIYDLKVGYTLGHADISILKAMARQLLAGMEQEPDGWQFLGVNGLWVSVTENGMMEALKEGCDVRPLYAAPQLPQPAVTKWPAPHKNNQSQRWQVCPEFLHQIREQIGDDEENYDLCPSLEMVEAVLLSAAMLQGADGNSPVITDDVRRMDWLVSKTVDVREPMVYGSHSLFWSQTITDEEDDYHATKLREQIDAAMAAENAAAPQQEVTTDNTTQQFESLGLIVTSDERKMELPRCSKHSGTELQIHPFEMLLSYPPKPVMYCPLCRPSVAKWVEFDNQLRQWKEVK